MAHAEIGVEYRDAIVVLWVSGDVRTGRDVAPFQSLIKEQIGNGIVQVVFDLSGVSAWGTPLLGALAGSYASLRNAGGDIRLTGVPEKIQGMIDVALLSDVFRTCETVDAAVASLRAEAEA